MSVWDELVGQQEAIDVFRAASESELASATSHDSAMTHSWLVTGPPGSGRSNLAYAFAASLLCRDGGCGKCSDCTQVAARTHPDLATLTTERVIISIDEVRALVQSSQYSPAVSRYRVIVIEDADRMAERTSNVLLKALEEPPERTVWILCAPSEADLIPTIRSRVRSVRLRVPSVPDVAKLIVARDGVDEVTAERAARHAQSHIGMAHRLATNPEAATRREETVRLVLNIMTVREAVLAAARMIEIATDDAKAITEERDGVELDQLRRSMGIAEGDAIPANLRSQVKGLEEQQKRRATRSLRDGLDRILVDLLSVYRDVLRLQLGVSDELINVEFENELRAAAAARTSEDTLATMEAIGEARERIDANVAPALAMEALLIRASRSEVPA
ncbi:DNA polymerase III subunit delta' [Aurantimicrobium minutum]|uniref:DNA polymerase III subunit delta' n=1 Tax=Aurantimicrobium minutum TaxID=708131 RepID=UPI002475A637|nr:DNA polymerase III subunit delta' [Aurantimicrobium minutum]MDH6536983.1 DNA polymerase-3 subunit delta' [Aurantimicrobium minutum]